VHATGIKKWDYLDHFFPFIGVRSGTVGISTFPLPFSSVANKKYHIVLAGALRGQRCESPTLRGQRCESPALIAQRLERSALRAQR